MPFISSCAMSLREMIFSMALFRATLFRLPLHYSRCLHDYMLIAYAIPIIFIDRVFRVDYFVVYAFHSFDARRAAADDVAAFDLMPRHLMFTRIRFLLRLLSFTRRWCRYARFDVLHATLMRDMLHYWYAASYAPIFAMLRQDYAITLYADCLYFFRCQIRCVFFRLLSVWLLTRWLSIFTCFITIIIIAMSPMMIDFLVIVWWILLFIDTWLRALRRVLIHFSLFTIFTRDFLRLHDFSWYATISHISIIDAIFADADADMLPCMPLSLQASILRCLRLRRLRRVSCLFMPIRPLFSLDIFPPLLIIILPWCQHYAPRAALFLMLSRCHCLRLFSPYIDATPCLPCYAVSAASFSSLPALLHDMLIRADTLICCRDALTLRFLRMRACHDDTAIGRIMPPFDTLHAYFITPLFSCRDAHADYFRHAYDYADAAIFNILAAAMLFAGFRWCFHYDTWCALDVDVFRLPLMLMITLSEIIDAASMPLFTICHADIIYTFLFHYFYYFHLRHAPMLIFHYWYLRFMLRWWFHYFTLWCVAFSLASLCRCLRDITLADFYHTRITRLMPLFDSWLLCHWCYAAALLCRRHFLLMLRFRRCYLFLIYFRFSDWCALRRCLSDYFATRYSSIFAADLRFAAAAAADADICWCWFCRHAYFDALITIVLMLRFDAAAYAARWLRWCRRRWCYCYAYAAMILRFFFLMLILLFRRFHAAIDYFRRRLFYWLFFFFRCRCRFSFDAADYAATLLFWLLPHAISFSMIFHFDIFFIYFAIDTPPFFFSSFFADAHYWYFHDIIISLIFAAFSMPLMHAFFFFADAAAMPFSLDVIIFLRYYFSYAASISFFVCLFSPAAWYIFMMIFFSLFFAIVFAAADCRFHFSLMLLMLIIFFTRRWLRLFSFIIFRCFISSSSDISILILMPMLPRLFDISLHYRYAAAFDMISFDDYARHFFHFRLFCHDILRHFSSLCRFHYFDALWCRWFSIFFAAYFSCWCLFSSMLMMPFFDDIFFIFDIIDISIRYFRWFSLLMMLIFLPLFAIRHAADAYDAAWCHTDITLTMMLDD